MNRLFSLASLFFFIHTAAACAPTACASDSDCADDSVCLIDAGGPRCTAIELAARVLPESVASEDDPTLATGDDEVPAGIALRDASLSFAATARSETIVMRPITVVVTRRAPSASLANDPHRSSP